MSFIKNSRASSRAYLKSTTLVEHCLSSVPLPSQKLDETAAVEIVDTISVGDGKGGAQIVVCTTPPSISDVPVVAKIYDPLYDMFMNDRFPGIPRDPIARADSDFTTESAAYAELDPKLGGGLIPRYHGSWMLELPLLGRSRVVYLVLMEKVIGVSLDRFPRAAKDFSRNERLNVMRRVMEADTAIDFAGAVHDDLAPRNVICDRKDLSDPELGIRVIDFNTAQIYRLLGSQAPCTTYMLPESPVRRYWDDHVVEMGDWAEDYYDNEEAWRSWLVETWGTSDAYQPVEPEFLSQDR